MGTKVLFVLGILAILWMLFVFFIGVMYQIDGVDHNTDEENAEAARTMYLCTGMTFPAAALFLGLWYIRKNKEDMIDDIASYLKMYRRISLQKVAQRLGITEMKAEGILLDCIASGAIRGFLDRQTGEFILKESVGTMKAGMRCNNCGGYSEEVTLPGEVVKCKFCGMVLSGARQTMPPHNYPPPPPPQSKATCLGCERLIPPDSMLCPYCGRRVG